MKKLLSFCVVLLSTLSFAQVCQAFTDGCWNLVGGGGGVELYITHKTYPSTQYPGNFTIMVYTKLVNNTDFTMTNKGGAVPEVMVQYLSLNGPVKTEAALSYSQVNSKQILIRLKAIEAKNTNLIYSVLPNVLFSK